MRCEECGAPRRSPVGPCQNCGAPPPGRGGRTSGANWGGRGNSGAGWGDQEDAGTGRGTGRYRRPQDEYAEVDMERALVPSMNLSPAEMQQMGAGGLSAYGDMPAEDVERLLGIRRPVYIPAVGGKRKIRVGSWRVISGVLSIILVCVASCAATSIFGKRYLDNFGKAVGVKDNAVSSSIPYSLVPGTPVATMGPQGVGGTPGTGAKYITGVTLATRVDTNNNPVGITTHFLVNDTVYVFVSVRNAPQGQHTVCFNWYLNYQGTFEYLPLASSSDVCVPINVTNATQANQTVKTAIQYPQPGVGMVRVYWDRPKNDTNTGPSDPALAATALFGIYMPATPTTVPPTATPKATVTGTPGK